MTVLKVKKDITANFGPIRDQGKRPTCLAFAVSDAHASMRSEWASLSPEYIFYHAQILSGRLPTQGASLQAVLETLKTKGQPYEKAWPYSPSLTSKSILQPPKSIAPLFRRDNKVVLIGLEKIIEALDANLPVILLIHLSKDFFCVGMDALVDLSPSSQPDPQRRHAVVAIAYGEIRGQRAILVRNSWGSDWGYLGCAWLTEDFLKAGLFAMALLGDELNVSTDSITA